MKNLFTTYFFITLILVSILAPTYYSLSKNVHEISVVEVNDEDKKEKKTVDFEDFKIYQTTDITSVYGYLALKNRISFFAKNYTSQVQSLDSPPPEFTT